MRLNQRDDDYDISEIDVTEIESVDLSDTPKSTANTIASGSPGFDAMNGNHSEAISASSNTSPNGQVIDIDTQSLPEKQVNGEERFKMVLESLKKDKGPTQIFGDRVEKSTTIEMEPTIDRSEMSSNSLKRKSSPSESPQNTSTSPTAHRPHRRSDIATPRQPTAAVSERQSNTHHILSGQHKSPSELRKIEQEATLLREALLHVSTEAMQTVLREQWRNFLFTNADDQHITFVLRAGLKNANPSSLARVFKDSGVMKETFVEAISSKQPVVAKVLRSASANQISDLVPGKILDQALAERLKSVPAKTLIRWLAEADRLGYSLDDILDENDETVIPKIPSRAQSYEDVDTEMAYDEPKNPERPSLDPLMAEQQRITALQKAQVGTQQHAVADLRCPTCTYRFDTVRGYNFHRSKNICTKAQPPGLKFYCSNCAQGFTTKQGMLYHEKKRVCLGEEGEDDEEVLFSDHFDRMAAFESRLLVTHSPRDQYLTDLNASLHSEHYPHGLHSPNTSVPIRNIPRPPLHTPVGSKNAASIIAASPLEDGARQSPSELTPKKLAALESALQKIEDKYLADKAAIPADWPADKREARLISLKNGNASRKSQIRKSFGVTLRMRDKDKEAKKRRETFGTSAQSSGDDRFETYHSIPPITGYPLSTEQLGQRQHPNNTRMEMGDARPVTGFSPINAQPQHQPHPQAQPGHQMTQYSVPSNTQGFLPSFPPLRSYSRPGQHISPYGNGPASEQDYGGEDYANKRIKRNSTAGMSREEEERSRHFAPSDSTPMAARGRSPSGSQVRGGVAGPDGFRTMREGDHRPTSSGSNGVHGQENLARPVKRVPTKGSQRNWEALNGRGSGADTGVLMSVEGGENGHTVMEQRVRGQLAGSRGLNVVDLISEDGSTGASGDSGDEHAPS
ncbi:hypothetical protein EYC84_010164 [Monilinia fructicola]|uniref:C2H2-type domain-containing protein n=1 Tax=Monilinia fructicola TaxID=38448 RepID=A0A5M9JJ17_MONFR|nr:hypothetical protein EYC84_010164 [Monilinia fructicola]